MLLNDVPIDGLKLSKSLDSTYTNCPALETDKLHV